MRMSLNCWGLLALTFLSLGCLLLIVLPHVKIEWRQKEVSELDFDKVRIGMSKDEVKSILGNPEDPGWSSYDVPWGVEYPEYWLGRHSFIVIGFDKDDRVAAKEFSSMVGLQKLCQRSLAFGD
jgi:hypothetical protein